MLQKCHCIRYKTSFFLLFYHFKPQSCFAWTLLLWSNEHSDILKCDIVKYGTLSSSANKKPIHFFAQVRPAAVKCLKWLWSLIYESLSNCCSLMWRRWWFPSEMCGKSWALQHVSKKKSFNKHLFLSQLQCLWCEVSTGALHDTVSQQLFYCLKPWHLLALIK